MSIRRTSCQHGLRAALLAVVTLLATTLAPVAAAAEEAPSPLLVLADSDTLTMVRSDGTTQVLATGLGFGLGVARATDGSYLVADQATVWRVPAEGGGKTPFATGFGRAVGVAVDSSGNVFVSDWDRNEVVKFAPDGTARTRFAAVPGTPAGMAFDHRGNLLVAAFYGGVIHRVSPAGVVATLTTGLRNPTMLAMAPDRTIVVGDEGADRVLRIPATGGPAAEIGAIPVVGGVAVDRLGSVYANEGVFGNGRVHRLPADGGPSTVFAAGPFDNPIGMALVTPWTSQAITMTSTAPEDAVVGESHTPAATSDSGLLPTFTATPDAVCSVAADGAVSFEHPGSCAITAEQPGDRTYAPAPPVTQTVIVGKASQAVSFTSQAPVGAVVGDTYTPTATGGPSGQPVTFTIAQPTAGDATCTIDGLGEVTFTDPGTCTVQADQAGDADHTEALSVPQPVAVEVAATTLDLTVTGSGPSAVVTGPGRASAPTGPVTFTVDGRTLGTGSLAPVAGRPGVASVALAKAVPTGLERTVRATYGGDARRGGSTDSYDRVDPRLRATFDSVSRPNRTGWYQDPVTVTYTCTPGTAPLTVRCPIPVTRSNSDDLVERRIRATDGGSDALALNVKVDTAAPLMTTVRRGTAPYWRSARPISCTASDARSGLEDRCAVSYGPLSAGSAGQVRRTWTATVSDRAGNQAVRRGSFPIRGAIPPEPTPAGGISAR